MSYSDGPNDNQANSRKIVKASPHGTVEVMLFESLVHHLIEKGLLTKNDALSVVGTVASVKQGQVGNGDGSDDTVVPELAMLHRIFESLKAIQVEAARIDGHNVHQLRPSLHSDTIEFPPDD